MGDMLDLYNSANYWYSGYQHVTGMGESPAWSAGGIAADFIGFMQPIGQATARALGATRAAAALETPIIEAALTAMNVMNNLCGFGGPNNGEQFAHGSDAFNAVKDELGSCRPPDSWQGSGSEAYGDRNTEHQQRAASLAEVDRTVHDVLKNEAEQVGSTRTTLDHNQTILTAFIPAAIAATFVPPPGAGLALSLSIQTAGVALTLPPCTEEFTQLGIDAAHNATLIRRAGASYDQIASAAQAANK
ncbi:EspA/EspE family type VII secretion system effector [Mycobacterium sp. PDNC021]|uniref:EspA/EspE family type VII secretion system effector n=1 Tax=Mycobacterium sp. PDNC021 TaxID=3391399 RepID=UPI003AAE85D3